MGSDCNSCQPTPPLMPKRSGKTCDTSPKILSIDNPPEIILFHKAMIPAAMGDDTVVVPENGLYRNVLLEYEANGHVYMYSSDGIPTLLNSGLTSFNDLSDRPKYGGVEMTGDTNIPDVTDTIGTVQENLTIETTAREEEDGILSAAIADEIDNRESAVAAVAEDLATEIANRITADNGKVDKVAGMGLSANDYTDEDAATVSHLNRDFVTTGAVTTNASTVTLTNTKYNPNTADGTSEAIVFPVASSEESGVMSAAIYNQLESNAAQIDAILNGSVSISGLSANVSQIELTDAWMLATGVQTVINGAKINDSDNQKVWTYYTNTQLWYAATNTAQVTISPWTNSTTGTVLGSTNDGQIFAENNGTGSVNGWDTLKGRVTTLESSEVTISVTDTDPGEGGTLAANSFIAVY